jgi:membrane protease YdiL (CAAX protease family)
VNEGSPFWPFWNPEERRLRAGIRIYALVSLRSLVLAVIGAPVAALVLNAIAGGPGGSAGLDLDANSLQTRLAGEVAAVVCTVLSVWVAGRLLDRRRFAEFGFRLTRGWWVDLLFGFALGGVLMGAIFAVELAAGWATVSGTFEGGWGSPLLVLGPIAVFMGAALWEELFYRGYMLKNLAEGLSFPPLGARGAVVLAWALISGLFGVMHISNPNADAFAVANIVAAGLMLGLPYVLTGELAIPIGLHLGWNLFQNMVFGLPVSGIKPDGATVFTVERVGPALLTGGAFGPEGGVLGLLAIGFGCAAILMRSRMKEGRVWVSEKVAQPPARSGADAE